MDLFYTIKKVFIFLSLVIWQEKYPPVNPIALTKKYLS